MNILTIVFIIVLLAVALFVHYQSKGQKFIRAARLGNDTDVSSYIKKRVNVNSRDYDCRTALHRAAEGGYLGIVELLLLKGANPNIKDSGSRTPIFYAALRGHYDIVKTLINSNADINIMGDGKSPIQVAAENFHGFVVELLLSKGATVAQSEILKQEIEQALKSTRIFDCELCHARHKTGKYKDFILEHGKVVREIKGPVHSTVSEYQVMAELPIFVCNDCISSPANSQANLDLRAAQDQALFRAACGKVNDKYAPYLKTTKFDEKNKTIDGITLMSKTVWLRAKAARKKSWT